MAEHIEGVRAEMRKGERHGTRWTYKHYGCRCDLCVAGKRASDRKYRAEVRAGLRRIVLPASPSPPSARAIPSPTGPFVPAGPFAALLEPLILELGVMHVGRMSSLGHRGIYELRYGIRKAVRFDTADRLICEVLGQPELWYEVPELREIYETVA